MLKDLIADLKEQSTVNENAEDTLIVKGYGTMDASTAQRTIATRLNKALDFVKSGDETALKNAYNILYGSGVLKEILMAAAKIK